MTSDTRDRLLAAAAELFAAHGYRGATIQRIAELAGANIAAVNYHFGDKASLCAATLTAELERRSGGASMPRLADAPDDPEGQFERFVEWFVQGALGGEMQGLALRLIPEMHRLDELADQVVARAIGPLHEALGEIVAALLELDPSDAAVRRTTLSVIGQVVVYHHGAPILSRLHPHLALDPGEVERIARHVVRFSLGGLRGARMEESA